MNTIGSKIRELRKASKMTQKQLAEKLGLAEITIRQYENNKRKVRLDQLVRIANALNVMLSDIVDAGGHVLEQLTYAKRIKEARKAAGLTQKELGERMGVSDTSIAQYESGQRNPKGETLVRIANALNVPCREFTDIIFSDKCCNQCHLHLLFSTLNIDGRNKAMEYINILAEVERFMVNNTAFNTLQTKENNCNIEI